VEQARLAIPLDRVAVVMLDAEDESSRVVFSWRAPGPRAKPATEHGLGPTKMPLSSPAAAMNIPIYDAGGQMGEVLCRGNFVTEYSVQERELIRHLAGQLAMRLENAILSQRLQAREEEISAADEIAKIVTSTLNIDQVYAKFATELRKLVDFDRARVSLIDHQAGVVIVQYIFGSRRSRREAGATTPLEGSQAQHVSKTGQTLIREIPGAPTFPVDQDYLREGLRSCITVPLASNGRVIGTLGLGSRRPGAYGQREQAILERLAGQIAPAVENARLYEKLQAKISGAAAEASSGDLDRQTQMDLAHLLRTPLTSIKGYTSSLLRPDLTWPPELQREFLQTIDQETDRLDQAVSNLLTMHASNAGEGQPAQSAANNQRLLEQAKVDLEAESRPGD
jgi:GAF domain-containing protein